METVPTPAYKPSGKGNDIGFFVSEILEGNSRSVTWKSKLELTNNLVNKYKQNHDFPNFRMDGLAVLAAYLYFINTGKI